MSNVVTINLDIEKIQRFKVSKTKTIAMLIDQPRYYRGYILSDLPLDRVIVNNSKGKKVKTIISSQTREAEIFLLLDKTDHYQLEFSVADNGSANVDIDLKTLELKQDQYFSPKMSLTSPLMTQTATQITKGVTNAERDFWKKIERKGTPLIEYTKNNTTLVTFLYKGQANNVRVLGSPYGGHTYLSLLDDSSIWFRSFEVPNNARFSYRIAPNVPQLIENKSIEQKRAVLATAQPDPLNQGTIFSKGDNLFSPASTLTLPHASNDSMTKASNNPKGKVVDHIHKGTLPRKISLYQPNEIYTIDEDSPLLILFDGEAYLKNIPTPIILDNLIAQKLIPPMRAVFVNPPLPSMRADELTPNKTYAKFLAHEFMPWLCDIWSICPSAQNTILSGSSYGGLASMYIALQYPNHFGKVLSQSGSFWWGPEPKQMSTNKTSNWMTELVLSETKKNIQVYLNAGLFEIKPEHQNILNTNHQLYRALESKKYSVSIQEVAGGHDYFSWRVMLAEGLITLFSTKNKGKSSKVFI